MFTFDLDNHDIKNIHFIGIGGVSMSGIAHLLIDSGFTVSGSDRSASEATDRLEKMGAEIMIGQKKENIQSPDIVIYTDAILDENEELMEARTRSIPVVSRGVFLGALMRNYRHSIAVSGSHGKSTTTSMISKIIVHSDYKPSILLGGQLDEISGNVLIGERDYLVTEACEFKANILYYFPSTVIVLNLDEDHLDFYKNLHDIVDTFKKYMDNLEEDAIAILNMDDPNCLELIPHVKGRVLTFGMDQPEADYNIVDIGFTDQNYPRFTLVKKDGTRESFELGIIGRYNVYNAAAAIIACLENQIPIDVVRENIKAYKHLHRRMEVVGHYNEAEIMTDYGHHPVEIRSTLEALREHHDGRLVCIFQPHTYSRTKRLLREFSECFDAADEVIVTEIYAARENFDPTIHSMDLIDLLLPKGINAKYLPSFEEARDYIFETAKSGDLILTTGCGNPDVLAKMIVHDQK